MPKTGTADDNLFPAKAVAEEKKGLQDDGSYVRSDGTVSPPREPRREPYPEPEEKQVAGHLEIVESPDGSIAFRARRMDREEFGRSGYTERKRQACVYALDEVYAGQPRTSYSYDELEQIRKGELKR